MMEGIESFIKNSGLRKFGLALTWIFVTALLVYLKAIPGETYLQIQIALIMAVFGANVCEHITKKKDEKPKTD